MEFDVRIVIDKDTGKGRGFGFVSVFKKEDISDVIKEGQKESNTEALNQNLDNHKTEILQKSELLTKPHELIDFDAMDHFKENISFPDKNDLGPISPNSYYCINCKHSECGFYDKNKHINI